MGCDIWPDMIYGFNINLNDLRSLYSKKTLLPVKYSSKAGLPLPQKETVSRFLCHYLIDESAPSDSRIILLGENSIPDGLLDPTPYLINADTYDFDEDIWV